MLRKMGKRKKLILIPATVLVTLAIVFGMVYAGVQPVLAKPTLPGVETIVMENSNANPYVMLEIVPDKRDARLGYLIGGEEPVDDTAKSIKDMPVEEERTVRFGAAEAAETAGTRLMIPENLVDALSYSQFSETRNGANKVAIRGLFEEVVPPATGDYTKIREDDLYEKLGSLPDDKETIWDVIKADRALYRKYATFRPEEGGEGGWVIQLKPMDETVAMPAHPGNLDGDYADCYNFQYFTAREVEYEYVESTQTAAVPSPSATPSTEPTPSTTPTEGTEPTPSTTPTEGTEPTPSTTPTEGTEPTPTPEPMETDSVSVASAGRENLFKIENSDEDTVHTLSVTTTAEETAVPAPAVSENAVPKAEEQNTAEGEKVIRFINFTSGDLVFIEAGGILSYFGTITEDAIITADGTKYEPGDDDYSNLYLVHEAIGGEVTDEMYYIYSVDPISNGAFTLSTSYLKEEADDFGGYSHIIDKDGNIVDSDYDGIVFYAMKENASEYSYAPGSGTHTFLTDYTQEPVGTATYDGGFTNKEWIKKNVFDLEDEQIENMVIDVVTVTYSELTEELLEKADFLYFTGTNTPLACADIPDGIAEIILQKAVDGVPIVLNRSLYENADALPNLKQLSACLMQEDVLPDIFKVKTPEELKKTIIGYDEESDTITGTGYVKANLFIYDDNQTNGRYLISNDFLTTFTEEEIAYGYQDILDEIDTENFYLEVAGKKERIQEIASPATAFRYIINFGNHRNVTKTALNVLDLEPYDFEDYYPGSPDTNTYKVNQDIRTANGTTTVDTIETDSICLTDDTDINIKLNKTKWIIDNLAPQFAEYPEKLDVTIMGTKEFIGKLDDLNATYDLIYIGMDTSIMNTEIETVNGKNNKTDKTIYNDDSMNGLVYTHVGDEIGVGRHWSGAGDGIEIKGQYRLAGNDITPEKLRELKEYIQAGYAVILSDEFLRGEGTNLSINTDKVDSSSNMYKLIDEVVLAKGENGEYLYYGKNVNSKKNFEDSSPAGDSVRETFSRYLGISKLTLVYSQEDLPTAYNQPDGTQQYLTPDSDGIYRLRYKMKLTNDAAVELSKTNYDCKLYVDVDVDGRYEESEALTGLLITDENGTEQTLDTEGKYHLTAGHTYDISREVPEGYIGFLSWKLVFCQNGRTYDNADDEMSLVRSAVSGYSAVPKSGEKPVIKILQIYSNNNFHSPGGSWGTDCLKLDSDEMKALYSGVNEFEIQVTRISSANYIQKVGFGTMSYIEFLKNFDMIVLGFADGYEFNVYNSNEQNTIDAILAIREYTISGRSVMFTHDLNSINLNKAGRIWLGYYANMYLRDVQGMDRYGVTQASGRIPQENKYQYLSRYDSALQQGVQKDDTGLSNPAILDYEFKQQGISRNLLGENARNASWHFRAHIKYPDTNESAPTTVSQVNSGQITEYPYKIAEEFQASHSHTQYMQLNMDTDSRDDNGNDDIVVWYTLGKTAGTNDSLFASNEMDVRNNYFIYNKGNVTYTGSGDKKVSSDMERKLFVNTLVAAYRAGLHAPKAYFKEAQWKNSATITSKYIPYDPQLNEGTGGFLDSTLPVNFYISNDNLQNSKEKIHAKYYIDGTSSDYDFYADGKYYKEIVPLSCKRIVEESNSLSEVDEDAALLTNYSVYTETFSYADLGLSNADGSIKDKNSINIYVRLGCDELENVKDASAVLPATESIAKLNVVCTQLFELK